ncbi:hypothetical protein WJX84_001211 [Apatococcus fuscideae]|uniref:Uncharacterized protein n=1 Tax=Apatococcus fuscideae TaxID=2026836 RepID=A0AAW1SKW7_9CHLO
MFHVKAKARAILEELILLLIRLNNGLADGSFVHRWTLRQAFDAAAAAKGRPVEEAPAMGQKAAARMGLLCATVCVAVNVTNAMNEGTLSSLVLNTAVQLAHNAAANCQADSPVRTSLEECAHARSVGVLLPAYRKLAAHFGTPLTQVEAGLQRPFDQLPSKPGQGTIAAKLANAACTIVTSRKQTSTNEYLRRRQAPAEQQPAPAGSRDDAAVVIQTWWRELMQARHQKAQQAGRLKWIRLWNIVQGKQRGVRPLQEIFGKWTRQIKAQKAEQFFASRMAEQEQQRRDALKKGPMYRLDWIDEVFKGTAIDEAICPVCPKGFTAYTDYPPDLSTAPQPFIFSAKATDSTLPSTTNPAGLPPANAPQRFIFRAKATDGASPGPGADQPAPQAFEDVYKVAYVETYGPALDDHEKLQAELARSAQEETDAGRLHDLDSHQQVLTAACQGLLRSLTELEREKAWRRHADFLYEKLSSLLQAMQETESWLEKPDTPREIIENRNSSPVKTAHRSPTKPAPGSSSQGPAEVIDPTVDSETQDVQEHHDPILDDLGDDDMGWGQAELCQRGSGTAEAAQERPRPQMTLT